nr:MAG TPA: hypothetical protein [Caudoviricetes sp.]
MTPYYYSEEADLAVATRNCFLDIKKSPTQIFPGRGL